VRFFLDNNLAPALARALHELSEREDVEVVHLTSHFERSTPDSEWIQALSQEGGWAVVSGDYRITKRPHEKRIWQRAGLTGFFLARGWLKARFWDQAWMLTRWWPRIVAQAQEVEPGATFQIPFGATGRFKILPPG
jgi:hypothetical protein